MFRHRHLLRKIFLWGALVSAATAGAGLVMSWSITALLATVSAAGCVLVALVDPEARTEEEFQRRRHRGWAVFVAVVVVLVLLAALGAPKESRLAFLGVLMLIAVAWALWNRATYRPQ